MNKPLTSSQCRKLKAQAQRIDATHRIGKNGISPAFIKSVDEALARRELIKIKFTDFKDAKHELAPTVAEQTSSHLVALVGNVAIFYRENPDPGQRSIRPEP